MTTSPPGSDRHEVAAARNREVFSDEEIIDFVAEWYGVSMANRVRKMLLLDPNSETGFCRSVRRSLTREMKDRRVSA